MNFFTVKSTHRNIFFTFLLIFIGASIGGYILWVSESKTEVGREITSTETHKFWKEKVLQQGAEAAYEKFTVSVEGLSNGRQHEEVHTFGGALYQAVGTDGLVTCDSRFDYGCFHEFLGRAIAELGLQSVKELNETCIQMLGEDGAGFCQHGLGHGVQSYFGYAETDFDKALAACSNLPGNDPIGGCNGGIFMEYNLRSMLADEGVIRKADHYLNPCDRLEDAYLPACYYWQPQWWYETLIQTEEDTRSIFTELGKRCDTVTIGKGLKQTCFQGIGNIPQKENTEVLPNVCDSISKSEENRKACWLSVR